MILYHYTNLPAGVKIMQEGFLKVSNKIQNPELWWPNGYGEQKLYNIPIAIYDGDYIIESQTKT